MRNLSIRRLGFALAILATGTLASPPLGQADERKGVFIKSVTLKGPSSCSKDQTVTVTATVTNGLELLGADVVLWEEDVLLNDKVDTQHITKGPGDSIEWTETVTFTFTPSKFEKGKRLELFAKAGDARSKTIYVTCR